MKKISFISSYIIIILLFIFPAIALAAGSANISWLPNDEPDLAGYRVYYGTSEGGPYGSSTALIPEPATSCTISDLTDGTTYYFVVVAVDTSDNESTWSDEVSKIIGIPTPSSVTLTSNLTSPQDEGTSIIFTAAASGGSGDYEYAFIVKGQASNSVWQTGQSYSSSNTFTWNTNDWVGQNAIMVYARNAGSTAPYETSKYVYYFINEEGIGVPNSVTLTPNVSSPQYAGTTVIFTASASGGSGDYEYAFIVKGQASNSVWQTVQSYSSLNTFTWNTNDWVGQNAIMVYARNAGSTAPYETSKYVYYFINEEGIGVPNSVTLTPNIQSPQSKGTSVTFTASASGGSGDYEYAFIVKGQASNSVWQTVQSYSSSNTFTWNTNDWVGQNAIMVYARNAGSTAPYETSKYVYYFINEEGVEVPNSVTLTPNIQSPQPAGTSVTFTALASGGSGSYEYKFLVKGQSTGSVWQMAQSYSSSNTFTWDTTNAAGQNAIMVYVRNAGSSESYQAYKYIYFPIE